MPTVYNKVTAGNQTLIDLSQDTVTLASHIMAGFVGHLADGTQVTGTGQGGGGGLEYETGTYTPTSNVAKPTISYANTHSTFPLYIMMADSKDTYNDTSYTNYAFNFFNYYALTGAKIYTSSNSVIYAVCFYQYRTTNANTLSTNNTYITRSPSDTGTGTNDYGNWVTTTGFMPNTNSTSRYWRSGRTYKWIAVWAPTT